MTFKESGFMVGAKVILSNNGLATIACKCKTDANLGQCWVMKDGGHHWENNLKLVSAQTKFYKAVGILENGDMVSTIGGRDKEGLVGKGRPVMTYQLGQLSMAETELPGLFIFDNSAEAAQHAKEYCAESWGKDAGWAVLEGVAIRETGLFNLSRTAQGFLPIRIVESCLYAPKPKEPEEVWEDVTNQCQYQLGGCGNNVRIIHEGHTVALLMADGLAGAYVAGFPPKDYAIATDEDQLESAGSGFAILHKVA